MLKIDPEMFETITHALEEQLHWVETQPYSEKYVEELKQAIEFLWKNISRE